MVGNKGKNIMKIQSLVMLLISLFFSILFSYTLFSQYFTEAYPKSIIVIENTAKKNENSQGTDVYVKSVKVNGEEIIFEESEKYGDWKYENGLNMVINPSNPSYLVAKIQNGETLEIELLKHGGSGIVKLYEDGKLLETIDLYSPQWDNVVLKKNLGKISIVHNLIPFLLLYISAFLVLVNFKKVFKIINAEPCVLKSLKGFGGIVGVYLVGAFYFEQVDMSLAVSLIVLCVCYTLAISLCDFLKDKDDYLKTLVAGLLILLSSVVVCLLVERINENIIDIKYIFGNAVAYGSIFFLMIFWIRRLATAVSLTMILLFGYAVANYYVTLFRGSPILPGDFLTIGTAAEVLGNYQYTIGWPIYSSLCLGVAWCMAMKIISVKVGKIEKRYVLYWTFPATMLICAVISTDFFAPSLDLWNLNSNVKEYGLAMSLISNVRRMHMTEPEGYSYEYIEKLSNDYMQKTTKEEFTPNVIAIMNESFSDLSVISNVLDSDTYMPFYNSLEENTVKGTMLASTIGGGTANTEYEFLTGNSMAFIPGTVPFQQFIKPDTYSLVGNLKDQGYQTVAIHPYYEKGYSRYKVYPNLGFDEFLKIEDFTNPELERELYVTDEESYNKVIQMFEQYQKSDAPVFIFNVTIQNHSGYSTGYFGKDVISVPGYEGKFADVEEYLTLLKKSDDAFQTLINYFSEIEEPTVILMFGDHQPKVSDDFYETMFGKTMEQWDFTDTQKRYEVPFFIWANYDIHEQQDVLISANYLSSFLCEVANMKMIPYQRYLLELHKKVPMMNINGYWADDNKWHRYSEETTYKPLLDMYWNIQYNNMFFWKKCEKWFVYNN